MSTGTGGALASPWGIDLTCRPRNPHSGYGDRGQQPDQRRHSYPTDRAPSHQIHLLGWTEPIVERKPGQLPGQLPFTCYSTRTEPHIRYRVCRPVAGQILHRRRDIRVCQDRFRGPRQPPQHARMSPKQRAARRRRQPPAASMADQPSSYATDAARRTVRPVVRATRCAHRSRCPGRIGRSSTGRDTVAVGTAATMQPPRGRRHRDRCRARRWAARRSRANRSAVTTSRGSAQRAISAGRRSIAPFHTRRVSA